MPHSTITAMVQMCADIECSIQCCGSAVTLAGPGLCGEIIFLKAKL